MRVVDPVPPFDAERAEVRVSEFVVREPMFPVVAKRLVELAVFAKVLVEVAKVVVPNDTVSEPMVEEAEMMIPRVVVGARYPFPCTERSRKSEVYTLADVVEKAEIFCCVSQ